MGAVLYIRVSTDEQAQHGVSLDAQEERLRAYCTMRDLEISGVVRDEGVSAFKYLDTRPGGAELLSMVALGKAEHIVALKLDRLFRNTADALATTEKWSRKGVALHLVDMGGAAMDTTSATGRMLLTMLAGFAEFERTLTSERTRAALHYKRDHGQVYGPTPYGYDRDGMVLTENADELATVAAIKARRGEGLSLRAIAARLTDADVPTKLGGHWWSRTVSLILDNDLYDAVPLAAHASDRRVVRPPQKPAIALREEPTTGEEEPTQAERVAWASIGVPEDENVYTPEYRKWLTDNATAGDES